MPLSKTRFCATFALVLTLVCSLGFSAIASAAETSTTAATASVAVAEDSTAFAEPVKDNGWEGPTTVGATKASSTTASSAVKVAANAGAATQATATTAASTAADTTPPRAR